MTESQLESYLRRNWQCQCMPYRAIFRGHGGPKIMLVHNVSCTKDLWARVTRTLWIPKSAVKIVRKGLGGCTSHSRPSALGPEQLAAAKVL